MPKIRLFTRFVRFRVRLAASRLAAALRNARGRLGRRLRRPAVVPAAPGPIRGLESLEDRRAPSETLGGFVLTALAAPEVTDQVTDSTAIRIADGSTTPTSDAAGQ